MRGDYERFGCGGPRTCTAGAAEGAATLLKLVLTRSPEIARALERAANIARARELLGAAPAPRLLEPEEKTPPPDEPRVLPCPCPCCGGRMLVIASYAAASPRIGQR